MSESKISTGLYERIKFCQFSCVKASLLSKRTKYCIFDFFCLLATFLLSVSPDTLFIRVIPWCFAEVEIALEISMNMKCHCLQTDVAWDKPIEMCCWDPTIHLFKGRNDRKSRLYDSFQELVVVVVVVSRMKSDQGTACTCSLHLRFLIKQSKEKVDASPVALCQQKDRLTTLCTC